MCQIGLRGNDSCRARQPRWCSPPRPSTIPPRRLNGSSRQCCCAAAASPRPEDAEPRSDLTPSPENPIRTLQPTAGAKRRSIAGGGGVGPEAHVRRNAYSVGRPLRVTVLLARPSGAPRRPQRAWGGSVRPVVVARSLYGGGRRHMLEQNARAASAHSASSTKIRRPTSAALGDPASLCGGAWLSVPTASVPAGMDMADDSLLALAKRASPINLTGGNRRANPNGSSALRWIRCARQEIQRPWVCAASASPTSSLRPRFFGWRAEQREVTHWNCWTGIGESAPFAKIVTKSYAIFT